jgi:hypothetical protein
MVNFAKKVANAGFSARRFGADDNISGTEKYKGKTANGRTPRAISPTSGK